MGRSSIGSYEIRKFKISDNIITNGEDSGSEEQSEETDDEFQ